MASNKLVQKIIEENYPSILRYCIARLGDDICAAEDCTQEAFMLFLQKAEGLDLSGNIRGWLYAATDRIVRNYQKQQKNKNEHENGDELKLLELVDESGFAERSPIFDVLTEEEYTLLMRYYVTDKDERIALAKELNISLNALYQRVHALKDRLNRQ